MSETMRLDKFLCDCEIGTRSEVKQYIKKGRVRINDNPVKDSSVKITLGEDIVKFDDTELFYARYRYYMLNKPKGVVSATKDGLSDTVVELLQGEITKDLFPVGRLDKDTTGLLLITNDGKLAHNLLSPKKHVDKTYFATVDKELSEEEMKAFEEGLDIGDDKPTLPAKICKETALEYRVTIHEGRYHQVKRMFEVFKSTVTELKRTSFGPLCLDDSLNEGDYRPLTDEEITLLTN